MAETTSRLTLPYPTPDDTVDVPRDIEALAERLDVVTTPTLVTALPGSPVDGQEVYFVADAAARVLWHLRYNAVGGAYKWEYLGGPPLTAIDTSADSTGSSALVLLGGPSLTLPLAGDWVLELGIRAWHAVVDGAAAAHFRFPNGVDDGRYASFTSARANQAASVYRKERYVGLTAGTLTVSYRSVGPPGNASFIDRTLTATPIRLG